MSEDDTSARTVLIGVVVSIVFGIAIIVLLSGLGLLWNRAASPYAEETRKLTYDSSRQYQQGTNRDIARYCEQMRRAPSEASRKAVAALIRSTASTYDGPLGEDNRACLSDAKDI